MEVMLRFLKPHWKTCLLAILCIFFDVAGALYIPTLAAEMLNAGTTSTDMSVLIDTGIKMAVASLISGAGAILGSYICAILSGRLGKDIRDAIYKKSLKLSVSDFKYFGTASITTRTISDITNIQMSVISFIQMALPVPIIFILSTILTFQMDVTFGWILMGIVVIVVIATIIIMKGVSPLFRRLQKILDKMGRILLENITGVRVVRAFRKEKDEEKRLQDACKDYADTSIKANVLFANLDGISVFMINLFIIAVYWLSGAKITAGRFQIGDINAVINYAILLLTYLMMAQIIIMILPRALECCSRIQEVLEHSPEITDRVSKDKKTDEVPEDVLTFDHVYFRYADAEENTLHDLDFVCKRGETTAIIGGTGSGKSTIASLILRFHDVRGGAVRLNGTDIREMTQKGLRSHLAYVQQKAWLFSGTIAENLRYSNPDATEEELHHALEIAQAADFVDALPEGIESYVAQGGTNFSGGQKQRLSIARALVKKADLYIFDDSFSALDFKTDAALRKALEKETKDSAVLIIAQRVSSIRHAEQIIVLNQGEIVGKGTHDELMETCSVYKEIVDSQTKEAGE